MAKERASLGFDDELENFDPTDWSPKQTNTGSGKPKPEDTKEAAKAAGFKSREPAKLEPPKQQRRRRTGRNAQFNIKARQETIDAFCEIADGQGWGLGETLEQAVELMQKKLPKSR